MRRKVKEGDLIIIKKILGIGSMLKDTTINKTYQVVVKPEMVSYTIIDDVGDHSSIHNFEYEIIDSKAAKILFSKNNTKV